MRRIPSALAAAAAIVLLSATLAGSTLAGGPAYVRAEVPWTGTTWVDAGATYDITARGFVHTAKIPYFHSPGVSMSANGPGGQPDQPCIMAYENAISGECMIEDVGFGTLIGLVMDGDTGLPAAPPFVIGADASFTAPASGWLFLGINDLGLSYYDNSGQFTVVITPQ